MGGPLRAEWQTAPESGAVHPAEHLADDAIHLWALGTSRREDDLSARRLVARYAGITVEEMHWQVGEHGKPALADSPLVFNLSHSGSTTLLALARNVALGVDVEHPRRIARRRALLARSFTAAERTRIEGSADVDAALLRHWAAKEAVVKAIGRGIAYGLHNIELAPADDDDLVLARLEGPAGPHTRWRVAGVALGDGAFGALAWDGAARRIECYRGA
jgi:4'-phosphopantetheinyl transferase